MASEWVTGMCKEAEGSNWWQVFPEVLPLNESKKWGYSSRGALKQRKTFSKMRDESRTVLQTAQPSSEMSVNGAG